MKYTKKQLEKMAKEAEKAFPKFREHFLKTHNVKDEKEFAKELMELSAIDRQEYLENSKVANQIFLSKSKTI